MTQDILQRWTNDTSQTVPANIIKREMHELKETLGHRVIRYHLKIQKRKNHIFFWPILVLYKCVYTHTHTYTTIDHYLTSIY